MCTAKTVPTLSSHTLVKEIKFLLLSIKEKRPPDPASLRRALREDSREDCVSLVEVSGVYFPSAHA